MDFQEAEEKSPRREMRFLFLPNVSVMESLSMQWHIIWPLRPHGRVKMKIILRMTSCSVPIKQASERLKVLKIHFDIFPAAWPFNTNVATQLSIFMCALYSHPQLTSEDGFLFGNMSLFNCIWKEQMLIKFCFHSLISSSALGWGWGRWRDGDLLLSKIITFSSWRTAHFHPMDQSARWTRWWWRLVMTLLQMGEVVKKTETNY